MVQGYLGMKNLQICSKVWVWGVWKILSMLIAIYEKFVRKISMNRKFFQKCLKRQHGMMMMVVGHSYQPSHGRRHEGNV